MIAWIVAVEIWPMNSSAWGLLLTIRIRRTRVKRSARAAKEIGIPIALGARPANITRIILRQLALAIFTGLIVGTMVAMVASRALAFLLFGLRATDAQTIGGAGLALLLAALLAGYLPVRRGVATRSHNCTSVRVSRTSYALSRLVERLDHHSSRA